MKKFFVTAAVLILGAAIGIGGYLLYQHLSDDNNKVEEHTPKVVKYRLDMKLAETDAEKEFFAMMNNYYDAIDKAVEDKHQGQETDFKELNLIETKIGLYFLFNEDKIRKDLLRKELLPIIEHYEPIMKEYGIKSEVKSLSTKSHSTKVPKTKSNPSGLISGPHQSYTKSSYVKNGEVYDSIVIRNTYLYETKKVIKNTSYVKVDLNDYFDPTEADWNYTGLSDEELKYLHSKNVIYCDTVITNQTFKGWYRITNWTENINNDKEKQIYQPNSDNDFHRKNMPNVNEDEYPW